MKTTHVILGCAVLFLSGFTACGNSHKSTENDSLTPSDSMVKVDDQAPIVTAEEIGTPREEKNSNAKKYVPSSIGDCFIGERIRIPNESGMWCEITFYPDGKCELKMKDSSLKGSFSGTVDGSTYNITVKFENGEEYDFVGSKSKLVADDGLVKYVVSEEM